MNVVSPVAITAARGTRWLTRGNLWWMVPLVVAMFAVRPVAQSATVDAVGGILHVRAPNFRFIEGAILARLKDGRSVRVDLQLAVLTRPGAPGVVEDRQSFVLSYDLWEERFAITQTGTTSRTITHLSAADAEAWCIGRLTVPVSAFARPDTPFWIRLDYQVRDDDGAESSGQAQGLSLRGLIDRLSRRGTVEKLADAIEIGPFRLRN